MSTDSGATGEWTRKCCRIYQGKQYLCTATNEDAAIVTVIAHNAALKAEREEVSKREHQRQLDWDELATLQNKLAAEREEVRIMTNQCVQLRRELAAKRERGK
jgi:hypothetical protein